MLRKQDTCAKHVLHIRIKQIQMRKILDSYLYKVFPKDKINVQSVIYRFFIFIGHHFIIFGKILTKSANKIKTTKKTQKFIQCY